MFGLRKRRRTDPEAARHPRNHYLGGSRASRLATEAARVREMLRAWAALDLPNGYWPGQRPKDMPRNFFRLISGKWWTHFQTKLGTTHGVGILMLVARLDTKGTGTLQAAEEAAFIKDADVLVEQLLGFATTSMVIAMLTISIAIPLCVYQLSTVTPDELIAVPSLGGGWLQPPDWYGAWMGSAALHVTLHLRRSGHHRACEPRGHICPDQQACGASGGKSRQERCMATQGCGLLVGIPILFHRTE